MEQTVAEHRTATITMTTNPSGGAEGADVDVIAHVDEEPDVDVTAAAAVGATASDRTSVGTPVKPHGHAELPNPKWQ